MSNFTAADVKKLRDLTGAGMMDCKKALEESEGDFDKAVEILRIKGAKDVGKRAGRTAANGLVAHSGKALLELNCETDFVAKNADFIELAQTLVDARRREPGRPTSTALLAVDAGRRPDRGRDGRGGLGQDRREAGGQPVRGARRRCRRLHAPQEPGPAAAGRRRGRSTPASPTRPPSPTRGASRCRSRRCGRSTSPATRCPPTWSPPSGASPRRPPARRASPRRPCPRSSRAGSTAFFKDFVLVEQASVADKKKTVKQVLAEAGIDGHPLRPVRGRPGLSRSRSSEGRPC